MEYYDVIGFAIKLKHYPLLAYLLPIIPPLSPISTACYALVQHKNKGHVPHSGGRVTCIQILNGPYSVCYLIGYMYSPYIVSSEFSFNELKNCVRFTLPYFLQNPKIKMDAMNNRWHSE